MPENRDSFLERCEIFYPHADVVRITAAYDLMKGHHAHQVRKDEKNPDGTPVRYFEHVRRVPLILMDEVNLTQDPDLIIEGLGHDSYEDTKLGHEVLRFIFGGAVSQRILLMSKRPKAGFRRRLETYGDWHVLSVKGADRLDNIRHTVESSPEFRAKQVAETRDMYYPLMDLLMERVEGEAKEVVAGCKTLRDLLRSETERVASI